VSRLSASAAGAVRAAIRLAGGREVCFVCTVDEEGTVVTARVVARGDVRSVLALPGFANRGEMLLHNHPSGYLEPSSADLEIAARMHDDGVGFAITDNEASELYVVVEVPREKPRARLSPDGIDEELGPDGAVAHHHRRYEDRGSQRAYARTIARLYNGGGIGLLEAGTGVGKSLGYLIPALRWSAASGQRTIVSTNTINLQEQLVGQDLPFLASAIDDQPVRFALLKGWRNYVCLNRLEQARGAGATLFDQGGADELEAIAAWAERTTDGSLADLATEPRHEIWDEIAAEPDLCQRVKCPHFERCFLFAARRKAAQADVIVVNHHLLLADLAVRRTTQNWQDAAVLPSYTRLIVDEGHHLEDAAASHLGMTVSRHGLARLFNRLDRRGRGLLPTLATRLSFRDDLLSMASLDLVQGRLAPALRGAREKGDAVFDYLDVLLRDGGDAVRRLTSDFATHQIWDAGLRVTLDEALNEIALVGEGLTTIRDRLESDTVLAEALEGLMGEIRAVVRRLENAGDAMRLALTPDDDGPPMVRWLEVRGRERNVVATAVPLDLAPVLRDDLFRRVETTIVTSATLSTDRRFDFLRGRLGLTEPDVEPECASFPSPFDYQSQALFAIPTDLPAPNVDAATHFARVVDVLWDLVTASDGGAFALFTSHRDVRRAAEALRARGAEAHWPLLVHGEDRRDALLRRFRECRGGVLLGTASFWEGVDVPGDTLRALLLARIPFRVPTEPLTAAHSEAIMARGGDPFQEYMLPHAALRLKQGFGRLIRTSTDRGAIVLTDGRVVSKGYGDSLLTGLPPARRLVGPWEDLRVSLERFYGRSPRVDGVPAAPRARTGRAQRAERH
jgi:ATP-dependent DNA helicase DinG